MSDNENIIDVSLNNGENVITVQPLYGPSGNGISSIVKTASSGLVDTYTIAFTNGANTNFNVTNGRSIVSCELTSSSNQTDTYTITYNDGTTTEFSVTNDAASVSVVANDISNIDAVAEKLAEIDSVADDLTNINNVAADLENIDAASSYADNASVWAEGTDEQIQALGGTHSAKVWSEYSSTVTNQDVRAIKANKEGAAISASASDSAQGVFNDIVSYAQSTADFTKFTVVGTLTNANGVISGFSGSNLMQIANSYISPLVSATNFIFKMRFKTKSTLTAGLVLGFGNQAQNGTFSLYVSASSVVPIIFTDDNGTATQTLPGSVTKTINTDTEYEIYFSKTGTAYGFGIRALSESSFTTSAGTTSANPIYAAAQTIGRSTTADSIDIKYLSVIADGAVVFSGNATGTDTYTINGSTVTIPFTWSKTGSKIVDATQSTNLANLYAQEGIAPYYMLDEVNGQFALPQGELYGMIGTAYRRGLPDYSAPVTKTNSFTAEADGFVYCAFEDVTDSLSYLITINGGPVGKYELDDSSALSGGSIFLPVSKGDVFLLSADSNPNSVTPVYTVKFYPIKGV